MKALPLTLLLLCCASLMHAANPRAVTKLPPGGANANELLEPLATGGNAFKISAAGTLVWENGGTFTGASYFRAAAGLAIGTNVQAYDDDLDTWASITPTGDVQALLGAADNAAMRTALGLVIGTNVQAYDADLTTYAGITPSANVQTLLGAADYAGARTLLGLVIGTNVQAYDADLTTYAGITPSANVQTLLGAADYAAMRTALSLGNVENTALSTWPGSSNLITLGALPSLVLGSTSSGTTGQVINISLAHYTAGSPRPIEVNYWTGSWLMRLDLNGDLSVANNLNATNNVGAGNSFYFPNSNLLMAATAASDTGNAYTFTDGGGSNLRQIKGRSIGLGTSVSGTLVFIYTGTGSPESVVTAPPGSLYLNLSGGSATSLYVKESGTGNTGWIGK